MKLESNIFIGDFPNGHIQGIAIDKEREYIYCSFTTLFVKARMNGEIVGTVTGLIGHLGCITYNNSDGFVYGSIEYKHDSIGKGIENITGKKLSEENSFYVAVFDVDKINRLNMDAEADGIMTAAYLEEPSADFADVGENGKPHKYGCSGIDGTGVGKDFLTGKDMILVAYGIYGDTERRDNDHQIIHSYDYEKLKEAALPLNQLCPHHTGVKAENRYFVYTGNTEWGVQNLEYDSYTDMWYMAVYRGKKDGFANPPMFGVKCQKPVLSDLKGLNEKGLLLTPSAVSEFPYGQTGIHALGNGLFYFSLDGSFVKDGKRYYNSNIALYRYVGGEEMFSKV